MHITHSRISRFRSAVSNAIAVSACCIAGSAIAFTPETSPLPEPHLPSAAKSADGTAPLAIYEAHMTMNVDPYVRANLDELLKKENVRVVNGHLEWPQEEAADAMRREGIVRQWAYLEATAERPVTQSTVVFFQTENTRFIDERHATSTLEPFIAKHLTTKPTEPAQRGGSIVRSGRHVIHRMVLQFPNDATSETLVRFEDTETPAQRDVAGDHVSSLVVQNLLTWPVKHKRQMPAAKRGETIAIPENFLEFNSDPNGRITKALTIRAEPGEPTITETVLAEYTKEHDFPTSITVERRRAITPELQTYLAARDAVTTSADASTSTTAKTASAAPKPADPDAGLLGLMTLSLRELRQVDAKSDVVQMIPAQAGDKLVNAMMAPERVRPLRPGERISLEFLKEK